MSVLKNKSSLGWRFFAVLLSLCALKWLLIGDLDLTFRYSDDIGYQSFAKHFYWGVRYNAFTLTRNLVYPVFLGLAHAMRFPAFFATELMLQLSAIALALSLRRAGMRSLCCVFATAGVLFHPLLPAVQTFATTDTIVTPLICLTLAGFLELTHADTLRSLYRRAVLTGIVFALLYFVREEGLVFLPLPFLFALLAWRMKKHWDKEAGISHESPFLKMKLSSIIAAPALVLATCSAFVCLINTINYARFGVWNHSIFSSKEVTRATSAFLSVPEPVPGQYFAWRRPTVERIINASPTLTIIQQDFRQQTKRFQNGWPGQDEVLYNCYLCWILSGSVHQHYFAQRDGTSLSTPLPGIDYHSKRPAAQMMPIFDRISNEIHQAQANGQLPRQTVWLSPLAANFGFIRYLPESFAKVLKMTFFPSDFCSPIVWRAPSSTEVEAMRPDWEQFFRVSNHRTDEPDFCGEGYWKGTRGIARQRVAFVYNALTILWVAAAIPLALRRLWKLLRKRSRLSPLDFIWIGVIALYFSRIALMLLIDATVYPTEPRYYVPALAMLWVGLMALADLSIGSKKLPT